MYDLRTEVCKQFGIEESELDLSMGMSADFEQAVRIISKHIKTFKIQIFGLQIPIFQSSIEAPRLSTEKTRVNLSNNL